MTERDLLSIGIKLLGLYLLVFGIVGILINGSTMYHNYGKFQEALSALRDESGDMTIAALRQSILVESGGKVIWSVIKALVGLYFCKRGKKLTSFLMDKKPRNYSPTI